MIQLEKGNITTDSSEFQEIIRIYFKNPHIMKLENVIEFINS